MNATFGVGGRRRLPNRRPLRMERLEIAGQRLEVGFGFDRAGRVAEIFVSTVKVGSQAQAIYDDAMVLVSILLQSGHHAGELAGRLTPDSAIRRLLERAAAIDAGAQ